MEPGGDVIGPLSIDSKVERKEKKKKEWLAWEWVEDGNKMAVNKWASA